MAHAYGYTNGYTMGLVLPCFYWQHFPCYTGKRNGEALPERAISKASRSVDRGSSDCFHGSRFFDLGREPLHPPMHDGKAVSLAILMTDAFGSPSTDGTN